MQKKFSSRSIIVIAALSIMSLIGLGAFSPALAECTWSMGWEDWAPYQFKGSDGQVTGLDIEIVTAIVKNAGCQLTLKELPWKRHLANVESGSIDLAAGASKTPEREAYAYFSAPYRTESVVLFVRKGEAAKYDFKSLKDLVGSGFQLGITRGYDYGEQYAELVKDPEFKKQLQEVVSDNINYKKLTMKRIDGFLADPFAGSAGLRDEGLLDQVERHPMTISSSDIFVMFSKKSKSQADVDKFNQSLQELKDNGTYERIINKYLQ